MRGTFHTGLVALSLFALSCSSSSKTPDAPALPACPPAEATAPNELRCTGLYADWTAKTLAPDAMPFKPGVELWSDGADKHRWIYLPPGSKIDTSDPDEWKFPVGTKTWKEFRVNGRRVETRFYMKTSADQWAWTTYLWSNDETKADRLDTGKPNAEGTYEVPKVDSCDQCHRGRKDKVLGVEAVALALPNAEGLTLAKLKSDGRLSNDVTVPAIPEDATGKAKAALAYLHINCGAACHANEPHSPGLQSHLYMRLDLKELALGKVEELSTYKTAVNAKIEGNAYFEYTSRNFLRIKPGVSAESLIPALAAVRDKPTQMPPVGSHQADPVGRGLVEAWIDAMPKAQ